MATAYDLTPDLLTDANASRVFLREHWSDDWEEVEYLEAAYVGYAASPSVSTAALRWRYGVGMRYAEGEFSQVDKLDKLDHWVKIEIDVDPDPAALPVRWYGHLEEEARQLDGCETDAPGGEEEDRVPSGEQPLVAYGLEALLDRQKLVRCWYQEDAGTEKELGRAMTFNEPNQVEDAGNRRAAKGLREEYLFSGDLYSAAHKWSTIDIARYLLAYHGPVDFLGNDSIQLKLDAGAEWVLPDFDEPVLEMHGRTLKELLDELMDRRRGLSYVVELDEEGGPLGDDAVVIRPFTFLEEPLELPSGNILWGNLLPVELDFDRAQNVEAASIRRSAAQRYEQVIAVGDRVLCCGSAAPLDGTLVAGWLGDDQTAYNAAASTKPGYPPADDLWLRQQRNADARSAESLRRVFRYFNLPVDWDGQVGNGEGGAKHDLFPYEDLGVNKATESALFVPDLRFHRQLPLKDYDHAPSGQKFCYRPTYVVLKLADEAAYERGATAYEQVENLAAAAEVECTGDGSGRDWCCSVQLQDDGPGIILNVSGELQHVIAGGQYTPLPDAGEIAVSAFSWQDNLIVTFAIEADWFVSACYPDPVEGESDVVRQLVIDARTLAQLHYVAPGTVIGLDDGQLERHAGGFVRDDRDLLKDLARLAYEWYGTPRQALSLVVSGIPVAMQTLRVGDLVTKIGADATEEEVRSVITEIRIDLAADAQTPHRTSIETQWAELDVLALI